MPLYLINDFNIVCITDRTSFKPGAAPRGGGRPPLAFKEGEEEEDVFGPKGPKNKKKMDINWVFLPIFEIQRVLKAFSKKLSNKKREGKQKIMEGV